MKTPVALVAYPLSHAYRAALEERVGARLEILVLGELRRLPPRALMRALGSLRGRRCLIPLEDPASRALAPLVESVAAAGLPASIELVDHQLELERVPRTRALGAPLPVAAASLDGRSALRRAGRELAALLAADRAATPPVGRRALLHLNASLWFGVKAGGSIAHTAGVANAFSDLGWDVEVAAGGRPSTLAPDVTSLALLPPRVFALPVEVNYWRFQFLVEQAVDAAAARAGVLYQRLSVANYVGPVLARRHRLPLVVEYNGSEVWIQRNWGRPLRYETLAQSAENAVLRHADVVVTISEPLRDELLDRGVDPDRIVCYPNCVDAEVFDPSRFDAADRRAIRDLHGIPMDAVVATFVGSFGQWHGADVLARAIRALAERERKWLGERRVHFLLVGDGLKLPEVRAILGTNLEDVVTLTGLVPQELAPRYLAASDILLSPHVGNADGSAFFGSPTKLFEYMAMERGIVASRLDQIADVLAPEAGQEVAVLVAPGDVDELVGGIRLLVDRPELRAELGAAARSRVLRRFTWHHHVEAILERLDAVGG